MAVTAEEISAARDLLKKVWPPKTNACRSAIAQAWIDGATQKQIAKVFGRKTAAPVNIAIRKFIRSFCPESCVRYGVQLQTPELIYGDDRKRLAQEAIRRYRATVDDAHT